MKKMAIGQLHIQAGTVIFFFLFCILSVDLSTSIKSLNTKHTRNPDMVYALKMECVSKINIFGPNIMKKSGLKIFFVMYAHIINKTLRAHVGIPWRFPGRFFQFDFFMLSRLETS